MKNIALESINNTKKAPGGQEYLNHIYEKAIINGGIGNYLPIASDEFEEVIKNASWEVEAIRPGKKFSAVLVSKTIPGIYNMIRLGDLPDNEKLVVGKYYGDNKPKLGLLCNDFAGTPTNELRAVCEVQRGDGTFLMDIFSGPDVASEAIEMPDEYIGKTITVKNAKKLGKSFCKVVSYK